jgi:hypothetical protein
VSKRYRKTEELISEFSEISRQSNKDNAVQDLRPGANDALKPLGMSGIILDLQEGVRRAASYSRFPITITSQGAFDNIRQWLKLKQTSADTGNLRGRACTSKRRASGRCCCFQ